MTNKNRRFAQWAAGVAVSLLLTATADAIVGRGSIDPGWGIAYPSLGFSGFTDIFLDNACLNQTNPIDFNSTCGGAVLPHHAMGVLQSQIDFYSTPPTVTEHVEFQAPRSQPGDNGPMVDVYVGYSASLNRNTIIGFHTNLIPYSSGGIVPGLTPPLSNVGPSGPLWIYFTYDVGSGGTREELAFITNEQCYGIYNQIISCPGQTPGGSTLSDGAHVNINEFGADLPIPEPGTLALLLAGLGGLFVRRRRQSAN